MGISDAIFSNFPEFLLPCLILLEMENVIYLEKRYIENYFKQIWGPLGTIPSDKMPIKGF